MRSVLRFFAIAATAATAGWVGGRVTAGGAFAGEIVHEDALTFGDQSYVVTRRQLYVPPGYGELVGITSERRGAMLWFDDGQSTRNVALPNQPLIVHRRGRLRASVSER